MASVERPYRTDKVGNTSGLVVFFLGVLLLIWVFILAYGLFMHPGVLTAIAAAPSTGAQSPLTGGLVSLGAKIVLLFVMVIAASLISSKGIHLYLASR